MPADTLKASIAQLNGYFKDGKDPQFGRIVKDLKPMEEGPWYAMEMSPKVHHCMGGLATTIDGKVLDVSTLEPIPRTFTLQVRLQAELMAQFAWVQTQFLTA